MNLAQLTRAALVGVHGGAKYLTALATGDTAGDAAVTARREACRACPSRVRARVPGTDAESDWCGPPLTPQADPPTCGCLLAGKTAVASEECPQGRWPAFVASATMDRRPLPPPTTAPGAS